MERLSHDLNLALEESNCGRQERRKLGFRRRTRSAGNLPASVAIGLVEDGSSSSPPQAPLITQPLSDSDDPQINHKSSGLKSRHYCTIGNFESDSFNENFSPTRPANARRKRKYKKMPMEYVDGTCSPPIEILSITNETEVIPSSLLLQNQGLCATYGNRLKNNIKPERNAFCGKRKWSHRDKGEVCEMRERSFSGGCTSKSAFFKNDFKYKKYDTDKKRKDSVVQPGKIVLKSQNLDGMKPKITTPNTPSLQLPGSSSFNFVYKNCKAGTPTLSKMTGYKIPTDLPPFFNPTTSKNFDFKYNLRAKMLNKTHPHISLRNQFLFEDSNSGMDCAGNESSSLSSSDSEGVVTNDSDREGDDELTDWPGIEELKVFNKSLTFKTSKTVNNNDTPKPGSAMPPPKRLKKEKFLVKSGWASCKNRFKKKRPKVDSECDDDAMMSDSKTVVDLEDDILKDYTDILQPHSSFSSFSDVKNAGGSGQNANETFFRSFQAFQEKSRKDGFVQTPRSNFALQKTSSSDLNVSEKSPQSDHYCSEHSMSNATEEIREIRAGCRRIRDERPGFLILSAANEQLAKFLQDSCQVELKLPSFHDPEERDKLESLAKLYSLDLKVELGRPVLKKTSNTMKAIRVEHSCYNLPSDHKRRCYGDDNHSSLSDHNSAASNNELDDSLPSLKSLSDVDRKLSDTFSNTLVDKSLLHPVLMKTSLASRVVTASESRPKRQESM